MSDSEYAVWSEANPDQGVVNVLYYLGAAMIAIWALGILAIIIAGLHYPAVY